MLTRLKAEATAVRRSDASRRNVYELRRPSERGEFGWKKEGLQATETALERQGGGDLCCRARSDGLACSWLVLSGTIAATKLPMLCSFVSGPS